MCYEIYELSVLKALEKGVSKERVQTEEPQPSSKNKTCRTKFLPKSNLKHIQYRVRSRAF